jgi:hypothetical protein
MARTKQAQCLNLALLKRNVIINMYNIYSHINKKTLLQNAGAVH